MTTSARLRAVWPLMKAYPTRLTTWLFLRPRAVWLFIIGVIIAVAFAWLLTTTASKWLTLSGLLLELAGIYVVARGMNAAVETHDGVSIGARIRKWLADAPRFKRSVIVVGNTASMSWVGEKLRIRKRAGTLPESSSLEQRVVVLEKNIGNIDDDLKSIETELDNLSTSVDSRFRDEAAERKAAEIRLRHQMKDDAIGDYDMQLVGLAWVAVGLVLSNVAGLI